MLPMSRMLPGAADSDCVATRARARHALERGVDGGEQHRRPLAALDAREPRQRGHALRHDAGMRRHPVVGQAIPGREFQHRDVGREERKRARQAPPCAGRRGRRRARLVAGASRPRRDRAREIGDDQAFGAVGDAGERERPAGRQQRRRGSAPSAPPLRRRGGNRACRRNSARVVVRRAPRPRR